MLSLIENFIKNHAGKLVLSLLSVLGICFAIMALQDYLIKFRFPDIEKSVETLKSEQKESMRENQSLISKKLDENSKFLLDNSKKQEERINKVESNISTLKVSLLGLMNKVGKAPTETQGAGKS